MNKKLVFSVLLLFSTLSLNVHASLIEYSYVSPNFNTFLDNDVPAGTSAAGCVVDSNFCSADFVSGSFFTAAPLAPNLVNTNITPDSFSFTAGVVSILSSDLDIISEFFRISTDGDGNVTSGNVSVVAGDDDFRVLGDTKRQIVIGPPTSFAQIIECALVFTTPTDPPDRICFFDLDKASVSAPGSWEVTLNPIPVPAAFWLFGTALIGLVGFSKRRKAA